MGVAPGLGHRALVRLERGVTPKGEIGALVLESVDEIAATVHDLCAANPDFAGLGATEQLDQIVPQVTSRSFHLWGRAIDPRVVAEAVEPHGPAHSQATDAFTTNIATSKGMGMADLFDIVKANADGRFKSCGKCVHEDGAISTERVQKLTHLKVNGDDLNDVVGGHARILTGIALGARMASTSGGLLEVADADGAPSFPVDRHVGVADIAEEILFMNWCRAMTPAAQEALQDRWAERIVGRA